MSTIWAILLAVTQVCVVTWSILAKSWEIVLKWWKLRLKQIGICKHQYYKTFGITDLGAPAIMWALAHTTSARKSVESGEHWCGLCVQGGKVNTSSFGMRRRKGASRLVFSLQGSLPTSGYWALDILPLEQMDLLTLDKTGMDIWKERKPADPSNGARHLEDLGTLSAWQKWGLAYCFFLEKVCVGIANCAFKWFGFLEASCLGKECYRVNMLF